LRLEKLQLFGPRFMSITTPDWDNNSWISSSDYIDYTAKFLIDGLGIHSQSRLLDIGCGRGNISVTLAEQANLSFPLDAVDISDSILEAPETDKVNFHQIDVLRFLNDKDEQHYDGVIMKQVFHLLSAKTRKGVLLRIRRCLKQGGSVVILAMPFDSSLPMFEKGTVIFNKEVFPLGEVLKLGVECGFSTQLSAFSFEVNISKKDYFDLLKRRFMSNLRALSDEDIQHGVRELNGIYHKDQLTFIDKLDVVYLTVD